MCPDNLNLFKLIYSIFWINFSKNILSDVHTKDVAFRRTERWCGASHRGGQLVGKPPCISSSMSLRLFTIVELREWRLVLK
jgi:hypothetical protein